MLFKITIKRNHYNRVNNMVDHFTDDFVVNASSYDDAITLADKKMDGYTRRWRIHQVEDVTPTSLPIENKMWKIKIRRPYEGGGYVSDTFVVTAPTGLLAVEKTLEPLTSDWEFDAGWELDGIPVSVHHSFADEHIVCNSEGILS